jgi:hypothetical protein
MLNDLLNDFHVRLADSRAQLGTFAPLPAGMQDTEPLVLRFERALAEVVMTGDAITDRAALEAAAEHFGAALGLARRVWDGPAADAVDAALRTFVPAALPMPVPVLLLAGKLAALLLGRTQRGLLIEYGPERATVCSELGLNPDGTLLFLRKPQSAPVGGIGEAL